MNFELPVFGVCGWSGSGKTTLIEELVRRLVARKLKIAVVKHDAHGFDVDRAGKDSDRFFRAGADALLGGPDETFCRQHHGDRLSLRELATRYDLVVVEGHKSLPLPRKVWLGDNCPPEAAPVTRVLRADEDRVAIALQMVDDWLRHLATATPVYAGVLFGGASGRMGRPKHLLSVGETTWIERTVATLRPQVERVVLLGRGEVPERLRDLPLLTDVTDRDGPVAGMLAAMRWQPLATWLFVACDLPQLSGEAVRWLLDQRAPGVWATLPRLPDAAGVEPLLAHYDFRARWLLEECRGPSELARQPRVATPAPPETLTAAWRNVNTPEEMKTLA